MNTSNHHKAISLVVIILMFTVGYMLLKTSTLSSKKESISNNLTEASMRVTVENTMATGGVLSAPQGFPQDIPYENHDISDSSVTHYQYEHLKQLTLNYYSSTSVLQKYAEYLNYMTQSGYEITRQEESPISSLISGNKAGVTLSVDISENTGTTTLVKISYTETQF